MYDRVYCRQPIISVAGIIVDAQLGNGRKYSNNVRQDFYRYISKLLRYLPKSVRLCDNYLQITVIAVI